MEVPNIVNVCSFSCTASKYKGHVGHWAIHTIQSFTQIYLRLYTHIYIFNLIYIFNFIF